MSPRFGLRLGNSLVAAVVLASAGATAPQEPAGGGADAPASGIPAAQREAIGRAVREARAWLLARQRADGSFQPEVRAEVCPVALTAMALWAVVESEEPGDDAEPGDDTEPVERAVAFLLNHCQPDGGVYAAERGLRVYTSGVAARAFEAVQARHPDDEVLRAFRAAELYAYQHGVPESVVDLEAASGTGLDRSADAARELLDGTLELSAAQRRALEFLAGLSGAGVPRAPLRTRSPEWSVPEPGAGQFSYDDVLPIVYQPLRPEHDVARRALAALRAYYTLDHNPDLTRRYGPQGFLQGDQGLYYYYLLIARTLSAYTRPTLRLTDGSERDWARELSRKLLTLQLPEGYWVNPSDRWWEGEPVLVTAYAVLALERCRGLPASR